MQTIDCIKTRRSVRLFLDREVPDKLINQILECAIHAPSSQNCQPWHFIIVKDKDKKEKLAKMKDEHNQKHLLTAPVAIAVCVDTEKSPTRYIEDGVTATQNILLAAHDLGLGAVYVTGCKPGKPEVANEVRKILSIPEKIMPVTILPVGYPNPEEKLENKTLLNINNIIHKEVW